MHNLLDNALRHTPPGGEVRLGLHFRAWAGDLRIQRGPGEGIPADHLGARLRPLLPRRPARDRSGADGSEVRGWPSPANWCVAHGGEISVESAEGAGTTFTVRLPVG